ncbi:iron-sulfur cluster assembly scaffold protein [Candidatus Pelagibacter sp.]|nr:iron-sulfur cluster assembly scaffold protein [Candidatus Pelagibacter sp.]
MDLKILKIASNTENNKNIKNYTHTAKSKNPLCGDEIEIKLVMKNEKLVDFGYQGKSCVYCQATASLLSKNLINSKKNKIKELCDYAKSFFNKEQASIEKKWSFLSKLFDQKNLSRKECILLPFNALKKIISN